MANAKRMSFYKNGWRVELSISRTKQSNHGEGGQDLKLQF